MNHISTQKMIRNLTTCFVLVLSVLTLYAQRNEPLDISIDFESYDPPSTLVVPEHPKTRAKYPFIDIHNHQWRMGEGDLSTLVSEMDSLNMQVLVNLSGRGGAALKQMTDNIKAQHYEDRFAVFTNINIQSIDEPDWTEETVKQIEFDVANGAKGLKIYKSQGMNHQDKAGKPADRDRKRVKTANEKCPC